MPTAAIYGLGVLAIVAAVDAAAETADAFYARTRVVVAVGSGPGGSHDLNAKLIARHIGRHLPGNPVAIAQNVPGAGSLTLANHIYLAAPQDGSYFGGLQRAAVFEDLYAEPGKSRAKFDPLKLNWIGSPDTITSLAVSWHTSPVKTAKDLLDHELMVGSSGGTSVTIPLLMRSAAGFLFKVIAGYKSGGDVDLAMERGEVEGRAALAWGGLKSRNGDWLREKKINLLFQSGLARHPELPDVPLGLDFARDDESRTLVALFFAAEEIGYPYVAPPNVPPDRMAALRAAFNDTMKDPVFVAEAKKQELDVNLVDWQRMTEVVRKSFAAPDSVKERLRAAVNVTERN